MPGYYNCPCEGNNFFGMPSIGLIYSSENFQYKFANSEYLMFPQINENTRETECLGSIFGSYQDFD